MKRILFLLSILFFQASLAQDYFLKRFEPYQSNISTPESFLGLKYSTDKVQIALENNPDPVRLEKIE